MRPMLATPGTRVPEGEGWAHEVKWDGMRVLADVSEGGVRLWSRSERDVSVGFPELTGGEAVRRDALVDGEVVCLVDGRPSFAALADRIHVAKADRARALASAAPATFLAFDLLRLDGEDLTGRPLADRRALLEDLEPVVAGMAVPPTYADGALLLDATREQGVEGIVSKRLSSRYRPGARSEDWLKFAHRPTASYVVGGWRVEAGQGAGSRRRLGAVLVGVPGTFGLSYRGRVGSGLAGKAGARLLERLTDLTTEDCPFGDEVPEVDGRGAVWVRPEVVVDVAALGETGGGRLRQPSYQGLRPDLDPGDLVGGGG